ncbi:hypothetical protein [Burkholderia stagnalis]
MSFTALGAMSCAVLLRSVLSQSGELKAMLLFLCGFSSTVVAVVILGHVANQLNLALLCAQWFVNGFCYGGGVMIYSISLQNEASRDAIAVLSTTGRSL